jgi:pimeloyl-ACP methyl ester carboxylesterase
MNPVSLRIRELHVEGIRTVLREAGPSHDREAVVFVHGNPGSSLDWASLMERVGGLCRAVAWDAPGFGKADKPREFPQTVDGHAEFINKALDALGIDRAHLVVHDFGGPWGLRWAATHPDRFASAVLVNTGVLLDYRWHVVARIWRSPVLGELFMAVTNRFVFRALLRRGNPRGLPGEFVDRMYDDFDRDTRNAVLRLYRATDVAATAQPLAEALRPLDRPVLVVWGANDPYIPLAEAKIQTRTFPSAQVIVLDDSGHWPFIDNPDAVETAIIKFVHQVVPA